ncbi:hypothetical protein AWB81_01680 [Caballeronia arationis]|jgi:hypothetical protein|uniref:Uncharacterized protein n=1 Tax=Caballeronia arationis TaxID=1777142 RepID=A0A7Z7I9F3_9BURK|nr:DUF2946 domain-containing protein [Caballeronia arationis]SAK58018.1 hypothetical protein AWB81_01680 [Caballeronia arationis]SOE81743.1 Protein of unknown function [Caballeronia arationis]
MTRTSRNRIVAWLGIAAMWLAIVAPVVSQTIAARSGVADAEAPMCSAEFVSTLASGALAAQEDEGGHHHGGYQQTARAAAPDSHHASAADHFDACSYCGLLAHSLPLLPGAAPRAERVERVTRVAVTAGTPAVHAKSFNAARPRAPPIVS